MDISKQSIQLAQSNTNHTLSIPQNSIISDVQDLKLEVGKIYTATVIQAKDSITLDQSDANSQLKKEPSAQQDSSSKNTQIHLKEWLISINGKNALVSSDKPLEIGQKLFLQLNISRSGEQTLSAQLFNPQEPLSTQFNATSARIQNNILTSSISPNSVLQENTLNLIARAIGLTLDKQLPLELGIRQFRQILDQNIDTSTAPELSKHLQNAHRTLLTGMLKESQLLEQIRLTPERAQTLIKQQLNTSGLFLEQHITKTPESVSLFKQQLNQIHSSLQTFSAPAASLKPSVEGVSELIKTYAPAIEKIQKTIEQLLKATTSSSPIPQTTDSSRAMTDKDLKATLIGLISGLKSSLAPQLSEAEFSTLLVEGFSEFALPSPFAFPSLATAHTPTKTLFNKTENAVGQILKLLAGMLNKIQFNQLHSLLQSTQSSDGPNQQTWFFELPVVNSNQSVSCFNFRLDKEEHKQSAQSADEKEKTIQWKLLLSFDLDRLGPIYILVRLTQQNISSELWADKESTLNLLKAETAHFKQQLEKIGLQVGEICCKKGHPTDSNTKLARHLVDIKA